jgi:hypothetical protein|tara:strand:- start:649 stop:825 length:177 start_codon:yes stop_codon:yes gene_type:complete
MEYIGLPQNKQMKNFISLKTGHAASDAYFKNQPIWFDSDMLYSFLLGVCIGVIVMALI